MAEPLTPTERRVYHYLLDFLSENTYQPSIREIGKRFRIGDQVVLYGRKLWPPCKHIVELSGRPEIFKLRIAKKCGIGADVLVGGQIKVGDAIVVEGP